MIRAGLFNSFGDPRPLQFWQESRFLATGHLAVFPVAELPLILTAPEPAAILRDEQELFGFTVSGDRNPLIKRVPVQPECRSLIRPESL